MPEPRTDPELTRTDPELIRQLDEAKESGDTVEAVVQLKRRAGEAPDPATVRTQAEHAIRRAAEVSGEDPADVHVMSNMANGVRVRIGDVPPRVDRKARDFRRGREPEQLRRLSDHARQTVSGSCP